MLADAPRAVPLMDPLVHAPRAMLLLPTDLDAPVRDVSCKRTLGDFQILRRKREVKNSFGGCQYEEDLEIELVRRDSTVVWRSFIESVEKRLTVVWR
jgi:hypothetical protein